MTGTLKGAESSPSSAALKIALDGGKVQLLTGPTGGLLYTADYDYPGASVGQSVDSAGVHVISLHRNWPQIFSSSRPAQVRVTLDPAVRWQIEVDAAGLDTTANLGEAAAITSFKASFAGGKFDLRLPPPSAKAQ